MMIYNAPIPPMPPQAYDRANGFNGLHRPVSTFGLRSVAHGPSDGSAYTDLATHIANGDPARAELLREIEKDGGESAFQRLVARLEESGAGVPSIHGRQRRSAADVSRKLTEVNMAGSPGQAQRADQLTGNGNFARVGNPQAGGIQEKRTRDGLVMYRFDLNATGSAGLPEQKQNLELSNCFYRANDLPSMPGLNPELSTITGEDRNLCAGLSQSIYSGSMSIKLKADKPVSATVFQLVPHHDGRLYRNENSIMSCIQPESPADTYHALEHDGMEFEQAGHSPFTMNFEHHDGQLYFTVKVRASYDVFDDNRPCDAPFAGDATVLNRALCCDGSQDVKYIYATPYARGDWLDVGFEAVLSDFSDKEPKRGEVKVWKDGQLVAKTFAWIGNNNRATYGGGGYHAQFGIADGSDSMVVKFKGVDIAPMYQMKLADSRYSFPFAYAAEECDPHGQKKTAGPTICELTTSATDPATTNTTETTASAADPTTTRTETETTATTTAIATATEKMTTAKPCLQQVPADSTADIANNFTAEVDPRNLRKRLERILLFGPRDNVHRFSNGQYKKVVKHLERFLDRMGVATFRQDFSYGTRNRDFRKELEFNAATPKTAADRGCNPVKNNSCNLCALIPGKSSNVVVAGAHLDTFADSPGANDNGSGVVALLEAIRIFKESGLQPNNPVLFCFWGSEERSPRNYGRRNGIGFGSDYFLHNDGYKDVMGNLTAQDPCQQQAEPFRIECYLNLAQVGTRPDHKWDIHPEFLNIGDPEKYPGASPRGTGQLTELYVDYLDSRGLSYFRDEPSPELTDVGAFYKHDIPAVTVSTGKDVFYYHAPGDDIDSIDFEVMSNATQAVVHTLATLSFGEGLNITRT